jgi:hypothetical protein
MKKISIRQSVLISLSIFLSIVDSILRSRHNNFVSSYVMPHRFSKREIAILEEDQSMEIIDLTEEYQDKFFVCLEDWSEEMKEAGNHKELWC